jgi:hypothetical protein
VKVKAIIMKIFAAVVGLAAMACFSGLAQQGSTGFLKTKVNPGRAGVFVDGKYVGPAANFGSSRKYSVAAGEHEVKLVEPRYEEMTTKVTVTAGKTTTLKETMKALPAPKPPFGRIRTECPDKFAAVYLNGKYVGHADEFSNSGQGLLISPGEYDVKVVPTSGGAGVEQKVKVEANKTVVVGSNKK